MGDVDVASCKPCPFCGGPVKSRSKGRVCCANGACANDLILRREQWDRRVTETPTAPLMSVVPEGFPCKLEDCPIGLFLYCGELCFKSEYGGDVFVVESGEIFWGGAKSDGARGALVVQPCKLVVRRDE